MTNHRETLNEKYIASGRLTDSLDGFQMSTFPDWYLLGFKLEEDGFKTSDFGFWDENGRPVMHWNDNESVYVDHLL